MRAFLAFEVSSEVADSLMTAEEELKRTGADLSPVERGNMHFTVKFLGDVPDSVVAEIDARMRNVSLHPVQLDVRGIGAFPNPGRPRVVWAGVGEEKRAEIDSMARGVIASLEGIGMSEDHAFHAHVTLARVRSPRNGGALTSFIQRNSAREFGKTRIDRLKLKSSVLTPRGAIYTDVREYAFS